MVDSIREQIAAIDKGRDTTLELVAKTVQPLARAAYLLLRTAGTDVGRFRKHKEFHSGEILIRRVGNRWSSEIEVYYDGQLVLHFNDNLSWITHIDSGDKRKYLFFFRRGEWQQVVVDEYRKLASMNLRRNFDVGGESCRWFNHDIGVCGKYENPICPCEDYEEDEEADESGR